MLSTMTSSAEKARALRLERLHSNLDCLVQPDAALETLMSELELGEPHLDLWDGLHAAAARDGKEAELTQAYERVTLDRRLRKLASEQRGVVLLHAADFFQGVVGDAERGERLLWRVLEAVPDHADALSRLERRYTDPKSRVRLAELYAFVAHKPPRPPAKLALAALNIISVLPSHSVLPDDACRKLLVLLPENRSLLGALESHCESTERFALACEVLERSLEIDPVSDREVLARRHRLIELYMGDAKTPEKALPHVEEVLSNHPTDEKAWSAAERLLGVPQVASRAAAILQTARRLLRQPA